MRRFLTTITAAAICLATAGTRADEILNLGDPAPKLDVSGWVKGDKVDRFEPGKTYVIEFWATWCGPCRQTIPHVTDLAHKYKDKGVRFIGVNVWENDVSGVGPFVAQMGDKMDYSVAVDSVPEKGSPSDGAMARNWMAAAEEHGIPAAFIVRDGKIAWIGHPMAMDGPLASVVAGSWNPQALARTRLAQKLKEKKLSIAQKKIIVPYQNKDYRAALSALEEVASSDPEVAGEFVGVKLDCLSKVGDIDEAVKCGHKLLVQYKDAPMRLYSAFFPLIELGLKAEPDARIAKLGLEAARRANESSKGKNFYVLDMLAVALHRTGNSAEAVTTEETAIKEVEAQVSNKSQPGYVRFHKNLEANLEAFRKSPSAKGVKAGKP